MIFFFIVQDNIIKHLEAWKSKSNENSSKIECSVTCSTAWFLKPACMEKVRLSTSSRDVISHGDIGGGDFVIGGRFTQSCDWRSCRISLSIKIQTLRYQTIHWFASNTTFYNQLRMKLHKWLYILTLYPYFILFFNWKLFQLETNLHIYLYFLFYLILIKKKNGAVEFRFSILNQRGFDNISI